MAIDNAKTLNVRIRNKYDSYENWAKSTLTLEAGEIAIAYSYVDVTMDEGTVKQPALLMKVGDGSKTFAELPWLSAKAADVLSACKTTEALTEFVNKVITDAGLATNANLAELVGKVGALEDKDVELEAAIVALNGLVGSTSVEAQINAKIDALKLGETYAAKEHTHAIADVTGLQAALDGKETAGAAADALEEAKAYTDEKVGAVDLSGIATNASEITALKGRMDTAEGDIDDLEAAIAEGGSVTVAIADAKQAGTDAQNAVDALAGKVGEVAEGKTVVGMIAEAQEAATYDDTELAGRVTGLETKVGEKSVADQIAVETERATGIEADLEARLKAVEDDYLTSEDKTELTNAIATAKQEAVATVLGEGTDADFDTLKEVADWILSDTTGAAALQTDVAAIKADYLKSADKTELEGKITTAQNAADKAQGEVDALELVVAEKAEQADLEALTDRVSTVEGDLNTAETGLKARMTVAEADIDALQTKMGEKSVADQISDAITEENLDQYALAADLDTAEGKIEALEADTHTHENATVLDDITAEKVAAWDKVSEKANDADLAAIAKTGSTDDLVQGELILVFDCGNSGVVVEE